VKQGTASPLLHRSPLVVELDVVLHALASTAEANPQSTATDAVRKSGMLKC
jgi:hypothetical protein